MHVECQVCEAITCSAVLPLSTRALISLRLADQHQRSPCIPQGISWVTLASAASRHGSHSGEVFQALTPGDADEVIDISGAELFGPP